jgi:hypothetical protein
MALTTDIHGATQPPPPVPLHPSISYPFTTTELTDIERIYRETRQDPNLDSCFVTKESLRKAYYATRIDVPENWWEGVSSDEEEGTQ